MERKLNKDGIVVLTPEDLAHLTRVAHETTAMYKRDRIGHDIESQLRALSKGKGKGGGHGGGGGNHGGGGGDGGGGHTPANADTIFSTVTKVIADSGLKPVTAGGAIIWGEENFEMLTAEKARYNSKSYAAIIPLAHIWLCAEVAKEGLDELSRLTGYTSIVSQQNNRGQAVGLLVHPDLTLVGDPIQDMDVARVHGVPELRPSLRQDLKDWNGNEFFACAIHLKSMRGGEDVTAAVRYAQCQVLADHLTGSGIVGGDWNCKLRSTNDTKPLLDAGGVLAGAEDRRTTQAMGGDLDGFIQLRTKSLLGPIEMLDWLSAMGRQLTDHNALIATV